MRLLSRPFVIQIAQIASVHFDPASYRMPPLQPGGLPRDARDVRERIPPATAGHAATTQVTGRAPAVVP